MYCSMCLKTITKYNTSCARFEKCNDKDNRICFECASRYVSSPIRWCPACESLGTCEMCCDYDIEEIERRKNLVNKDDWRILQMCPSCFDNYI